MLIWIVPYWLKKDGSKGSIEVMAVNREAAYWSAKNTLDQVFGPDTCTLVLEQIKEKGKQ
jgi:hypothetical protein